MRQRLLFNVKWLPLAALFVVCLPTTTAAKPTKSQGPKIMPICEMRNFPIAHAYGSTYRKNPTSVSTTVCFRGAMIDSDDVVTATLYQGKRKISKSTCRGKITQYARTVIDINDAKKDEKAYYAKCDFKDKALRKAGEYTIKFDYQSEEDEKTYKNTDQLKFQLKKGKSLVYASHDNVVGPVLLQYDYAALRKKQDDVKLVFSTYIKIDKNKSNPDKMVLRCKLGKKTVARAEGRTYNGFSESAQKTGTEQLVFYMRHLYPTLEEGNQKTRYYPFGKNPGKYTCKIKIDGKQFRAFEFTVEKDGLIKRDECSKSLGFDASQRLVTNKATGDYKFSKRIAQTRYLNKYKLTKQCKNIL